tara:strand:+ start:143 stop:586 length:444 start_codon:yes stop_codon:yes gene_type:complete
MEYKIGMKVSFGRPNGEKTVGKIVKVNPKKLKIEQTEVRGRQKTHSIGTVWTVPKNDRFVQVLDLDGELEMFGKTWVRAKPAKASRLESEILEDLQSIECGLSPENLSCDGELSRTAINRRYASLMRQKRACIKELGREPTFDEIWG